MKGPLLSVTLAVTRPVMHYVIVGNGVAGTRAAFAIRQRLSAEDARITLIGDESDYFFSRTALMYAYMNRLDRRDLEPHERRVYDERHIQRRRGHVVDLNADDHCLKLADGTTVDYDRLLLAVGARARMIDFGGLDNVDDGLVHFIGLDDLDDCERLTWSTQRAVVVGGGLIGVELAECLHHHGVEVTFLVREPYYWPAAFARPEGQMITEHIRSKGIDLRHQTQLLSIDVDDDRRVRAVATDDGETIPCQMLGIAIGVVPRVNWLRDVTTPPKTGFGLRVDRRFQTSLPDVFGAGDCVEIEMGDDTLRHVPIWYEARDHGDLAGRAMAGDDVHFEAPTFYNSSKFFDIEYTTVGDVQDLPEGTRSLYRRMPGEAISQRIVFDDQQVLGFSMLGSRWDHTVLSRWVDEQRSLEFVRDHLHEAQYDVEFGGLDLDAMNEEMRTL